MVEWKRTDEEQSAIHVYFRVCCALFELEDKASVFSISIGSIDEAWHCRIFASCYT